MPNPFRKKPTRPKVQTDAAHSPGKSLAKKTRSPAAKRNKPKKTPKTLEQIVTGALDDLKAFDVHVLDVRLGCDDGLVTHEVSFPITTSRP